MKIYSFHNTTRKSGGEVKLSPLTGRGGLWGCEMLRIPHFLDNRLKNGIEVVLYYPETFSDIHFCYSRSQWSHGLRHELSSPAPTLRSWVRIPLRLPRAPSCIP
jgi:hypothetical protein